MRVKNRKVINKLAKKSLKGAMMRNLMAIIAIALTTVLFTTLFTLGISTIDSFQQSTMRQVGTKAHGIVKYIDDKTFNDIKDHELIENISYNKILADSVDNEELLKRHGELWYFDDQGLENGFYEPVVGSKPIAENEIMMDNITMKMLGVPEKIGTPVKLHLTLHGNKVERDFVLSGWWESDPSYNASILITSKSYIDAHEDELYYSYYDDYSLSGVINAELNFSSSSDMENKLNTVIRDSGYQNEDEDGENYLNSNVNWSYLSTGSDGDLTTKVIIITALILVLITGYLIIYNIFQISVMRDIRFYGLLKTIGTTGKQIKKIIFKQAFILSVIGIPIGLVLGYFIGREFVPMILKISNMSNDIVGVSPNILIFICSGLFALITVWISTRKPGKIAARVSPVEAVKYTDFEIKVKGEKKSTSGGKLYKMSFSNLKRNRKRTMLVLLSLSLSLLVLNLVFTLTKGMDMDKYLSTFVDTDFLVGNAEYFNSHYRGVDEALDEKLISEIEHQEGFAEGGKFYLKRDDEIFVVEDEDTMEKESVDEFGNPVATLYGIDDLPLSRMEVVDGEIDVEKLKSGKYILYGIETGDKQEPLMEYANFSVGDKVTMHNYKYIDDTRTEMEYNTYEYEVMATVKVKHYTASHRLGDDYQFYIPSNVYFPMVYDHPVMSYAFNVKDGYEGEMEEFLKDYTENISPLMDYESKAVYIEDFESMVNLVYSMGGILSFIIGLIGMINFVNAILTGIITRRMEFAMLESVGMTKGQIRKMLCLEGLYYAFGTIIISFILSVAGSLLLVKPLLGEMWFMSYKFSIIPLLISYPFLIFLGIFIPIVAMKFLMKDSIVDRLRAVE